MRSLRHPRSGRASVVYTVPVHRSLVLTAGIALCVFALPACGATPPSSSAPTSAALAGTLSDPPIEVSIPETSDDEEEDDSEPVVTRQPLVLDAYCGGWRETWGVNEVTDVDYQDVYLIDVRGNELEITSPERPNYEFRTVITDPPLLHIEMVNHATTTEFLIVYHLELREDRSAFDGTATTPHKRFTIRWDRMTRSEVEGELGSEAADGVSDAIPCWHQ